MVVQEARRQRLEHLLELACVYKDWSRKELAQSLSRDPGKLVPDSGNPKLDLVTSLADVLDWSVGDVAEAISTARGSDAGQQGDFEALDASAMVAHADGRYADMVSISERMYEEASSPEQRALACNREAGGWDGMGRYTRAMDAVRRGLQEGPIPDALRRRLEGNLANAYYTLMHLLEARAISRDLIDEYQRLDSEERTYRVSHAFAHYVRGNTYRRLIVQQPHRAAEYASCAEADFHEAVSRYRTLATEFDQASYLGIASTAEGGLIEVEVELGKRTAQEALAFIGQRLEEIVEVENVSGDLLESYGWLCVFGCNIALRHMSGEAMHRHMAVLTNKGYEVAEELDHWAMRERVFSLEFAQHERLHQVSGHDVPWTIDTDEARVIIGTMGRFPRFRDTGWQILNAATVIPSN